MSWKNVKLIFVREVRDQLRDRRTLFMVAILPLLLYPAMGIGMLQMGFLFSEQPRTVVIIGAENLPQSPSFLDGEKIAASWFASPADAEKLKIITDLPMDASEISVSKQELLTEADRFREPVQKRQEKKAAVIRAQRRIKSLSIKKELAHDSNDKSRVGEFQNEIATLLDEIAEHEKALKPLDEKISQLFSGSRMQVLIVVPDGFAERIERVNRALKNRESSSGDDEVYFGPTPIMNRAHQKSAIAYSRVRKALENWEQQIIENRLVEAKLPRDLASPVNARAIDVSQKEEHAANMWSILFPALLVIMSMTGAFYPAIDLGAGEKERGTMETLLICPASRVEIVLGKFFTVMLFSVATAALNLVGMGITVGYMFSIGGGSTTALAKLGDITAPSASAMFWVFVLLIPLAALFSALCLALATFARSTKEGQYYLTPLMIVAMGLTVFCLSPAVEIAPAGAELGEDMSFLYSIMPIVGVSLVLKALLLDPTNTTALIYLIPVLVTSIIYSLLALWWAIELFRSENVLFRESERLDVRLWIHHLFRDKESTPSFTEAGFCFVLIMLLQFAAIKFLGQATQQASIEELPSLSLKLLIVQQLAVIGTPALLMAVMLTTSARKSLLIRMPKMSMLAVAACLAIVLHPLSLELSAVVGQFFRFPDLPPSVHKVLSLMTDGSQPLWLILLAFAIAPAICEELAFRGFILSGFRRSKYVGIAIVLSALAFGIMHMIPQQVFNATLLGLVLGLIAVRSNSLLPGIAFHLIYNCLGVAHMRVSQIFGKGLPIWMDNTPFEWCLRMEGGVRYQWPLLLVTAVAAIWLLRWILNFERSKDVPKATAVVAPHMLDKPSPV